MIHSESETERYYPQRWYPTWIRFAHRARYSWAAGFVNGLRVLDAACGTGYGSVILREAGAGYVEGVDLSADGIREAQRNCGRRDITFRQGSVLALDNPNDSFDVVISFETIEHVGDDAQYVREMRRVLRPGGIFLCSTPNRRVTNPGTSIREKPYNPNHVREYGAGELSTVLKKEFGDIVVLGQKMWSVAYLTGLGGLAGLLRPMAAVRVHQTRKMLRSIIDKPDEYAPLGIPAGFEPETLVAKCL